MVSRPSTHQRGKQVWRLLERLDLLETMVYGRSSSVTNGRTRFIGFESLIVIGSQLVSGLLTVVGRLTISGLGILTVNGLIELVGRMRVTGDIEILPGGKAKFGGMILDPANGGSITMPDGAVIRGGSGGGAEIISGSYKVVVVNGGVSIGEPGRAISVTESGFRLDGVPDGSPGNGTPQGNYYRDPLGYLKVSTGT